MFDVKVSKKEQHNESKVFKAGKKLVSAKLPWGKIGLTVCYDLRFPNLYRKLSKAGAIFLSVPSAFTQTTGKKHWHSLLKARAIENFCYVFAPAQVGKHYNGRKTYGMDNNVYRLAHQISPAIHLVILPIFAFILNYKCISLSKCMKNHYLSFRI